MKLHFFVIPVGPGHLGECFDLPVVSVLRQVLIAFGFLKLVRAQLTFALTTLTWTLVLAILALAYICGVSINGTVVKPACLPGAR